MTGKRLAIIGAGVTGLGIAKIFVDKGWSVKIFERESEVGGTWCKKYLYADLRLHSKTGTYLFPGFPFHEKHHDVRNDRASGKQVNEYIARYVNYHELNKIISLEANVERLIYDRPYKCVKLITSGSAKEFEAFDFVIITGHTTNLKMPDLRTTNFSGRVIHSSLAGNDVLEDAVKKNKHVVVLGGNKSATDMAYYFTSRSHERLLWVHRKTHWFLKEEKMRVCPDALLFLLVIYLLFRYSHTFPEGIAHKLCLLLAKRKIIINPRGDEYQSFLKVFHSGIMSDELFCALQGVKDQQAEIIELSEDSAILSNGMKVPCDLLICATGYDSRLGFPAIGEIDDRGVSGSSDIYAAEHLFRGHIHPMYLRIGFAHKRSVFFGAPSVGKITGSWFWRFFGRLDDVGEEAMMREVLKELDCEKPQYKKHRLRYGDPFSGTYVQENMWFWFLFQQRLYKKDLNLSSFYFFKFILKFLAKKTETHSLHI